MNVKTKKSGKNKVSSEDRTFSEEFPPSQTENIPRKPSEPSILLDENLITLKKVHAILLNCSNLTDKQKFDFASSERFFMKLYLKKLSDALKES
ncbi:MAG: hypothetical protein ACW990_02755 [Promethearchaeota archaeon]|jgi:hypothetical protein